MENSYQVFLLEPQVLNSAPAPAIPDQVYYIDETPLLTTLPSIPYTHSLSSYAVTYPAISTDSRL